MKAKKYKIGNAVLSFDEFKKLITIFSFELEKKQIEKILIKEKININILEKIKIEYK